MCNNTDKLKCEMLDRIILWYNMEENGRNE